MSEIVTLHHNEPMTTSLAIAEGVEMDHKSVIQLLRKHVDRLAKFGEVAFQMRLNPQGSPTEFVFLNEQQSTFLVTLMRNTPIVLDFKEALVRAFFEMRDQLRLTAPANPPFLTGNLAHGADLAVASERTFRSFLRAGRSAGLSLPQALRMANRQTLDRTGMNMLEEMGVEVPDAKAAYGVSETVFRFAEEWLAGRLPVPPCVCRNADLYAAYLRWCRAEGIKPASETMFHSGITRTGHGIQKRHIGHIHRIRATIPPGADAAVNGEKTRFYEASIARFAAALLDWN